jgi:nickel transport protein
MRAIALVLMLGIFTAAPALAHRVNIFAYVEGGDIVVECSYSKSKRVNHGSIEVRDRVSGEVLVRGETDDQGHFRFPVPAQARTSGSGLRILLQAGEGHQNEWIVDAAEFMDAATPAASSPEPKAVTPIVESNAASAQTRGLTRADVEEVVNAALDAKLGPIKRAVLEQSETGPGMQEIIGGIGWIFGLIGIAAYFKSRPRV